MNIRQNIQTSGFLPNSTIPLLLPESHKEWDELAKIMPELIKNGKLTEALTQLRTLSIENLDQKYLSRASMVLSYLAHGYNFEQKQYFHNQQVQLAKNILKPWIDVAQRLGYPAPAFTIYDAVLNNWRFVDTISLSYEELLRHPEKITLEYIEPLVTAFHDQVERVFHLTIVLMEIKAISITRNIMDIERALENGDIEYTKKCLINIIECIHSIQRTLENINLNPASKTYVDPIVWCSTIAIFTQGMLPNEPGMSGMGSPIFHLLDNFSNRNGYESDFGKMALRYRQWFSKDHLKFLDIVKKISSKLQSINDHEIQTLMNDIKFAYAGENGLLECHKTKAFGYINLMKFTSRKVTNGNSNVNDSKGQEKLREYFVASQMERLPQQSGPRNGDYEIATIQIINQTTASQESSMTREIEFTISHQIPYICPGSLIKLLFVDDAMKTKVPQSRLYTIVNYSQKESKYEASTILSILAKYVQNGAASEYLAHNSTAQIQVIPFTRFSLSYSDNTHIIIFSGGTGIAAFIMTLNRTMQNTIILFFSIHNEEEFNFYKKYLDKLDPQVEIHVLLTKDREVLRKSVNSQDYVSEAFRGRIHDYMQEERIRKDIVTHIHTKEEGGKEGQFYICGGAEFVNSVNNKIKSIIKTDAYPGDAARSEAHFHHMLADGRIRMSAGEAKFDTDNVSFTIVELVMHNNRKMGYWVAVSGLVYDISNFISQHPGGDKILVEKSGTDMTRDYQIIHSSNPEIHARLSMYFIGKLIDHLKDEILNEIKKILYACTRIENSINIIMNYNNIDLYRICIQDTQSKMMALFHDLLLHLNNNGNGILAGVINQFQLLNEIVAGLINENASLEDLLHILYRYKGLCYLTKYTLEKALISKNSERDLEKNLSLLSKKIEETTNGFTITNMHIVRKHHITIIGGSLCGVVLAIYLKKKLFFDVHVYDKLDDPRVKYKEHSSASFNITLSSRGFVALSEIGLQDLVREISIPLYGRCYHIGEDGMLDQLYGPHNEALYAVKRDELLFLLISEAEKEGIHLYYGMECEEITYSDGPTIIHVVEKLSKRFFEIHTNYLFGADGFNSKVRETIDRQLPSDQRSKIIKHKMIYREFILPANLAGEHRFRNDRLHIWPRDEFTILAFPNADGSFTLTLFIPGDHEKIEKLQNDPQYICNFVKEYFSDISPFVERLILNESQHRWGSLNQVNAHVWHISDKALILGDAAHAFYPFFGQAANSAFEDCRHLTRLIETIPEDWGTIFSQFQHRKRDTDTIANLSKTHGKCLSNRIYIEKLLFQAKISLEITKQDPRAQPLYNCVSFTDMPYRLAPQVSRTHDEILMEVSRCLEFGYENLNDQMITSTVADVISRNRMILKDKSLDEVMSDTVELRE